MRVYYPRSIDTYTSTQAIIIWMKYDWSYDINVNIKNILTEWVRTKFMEEEKGLSKVKDGG